MCIIELELLKVINGTSFMVIMFGDFIVNP